MKRENCRQKLPAHLKDRRARCQIGTGSAVSAVAFPPRSVVFIAFLLLIPSCGCRTVASDCRSRPICPLARIDYRRDCIIHSRLRVADCHEKEARRAFAIVSLGPAWSSLQARGPSSGTFGRSPTLEDGSRRPQFAIVSRVVRHGGKMAVGYRYLQFLHRIL